MKRMAGMQTYMVTICLARHIFNPSKQRNKGNQAMLTIDELFEAREYGHPVMISVMRARNIVELHHGPIVSNADVRDEFQTFVTDNVKHGPHDFLGSGGMVCAASLYEWLGY